LNILHRDLHPENILVHLDNDTVILKLCDFGLSKKADDISTFVAYPKLYKANRYSYGRKEYVHKNQRENLSDASFATETYSWSKLINFILTGNPKKCEHQFRKYCLKAIKLEYIDIIEMYNEILKDGLQIK